MDLPSSQLGRPRIALQGLQEQREVHLKVVL